MSLLKKIAYIFDRNVKLQMCGLMIMSVIGALLELVGVSILLPIIDLAVLPDRIMDNLYCRLISSTFHVTDYRDILLILICAMLAVYVCKNAFLAVMYNLIYRFSGQVHNKIAGRLINTYLVQPYAFFLRKNTSELIRSVKTDTIGFYQAVYNFMMIISSGLISLCLIVYLAVTNLVITVVVVLVVALCALTLLRSFQKKSKVLGKLTQEADAKIIQSLQQSFDGIKEIKIYHKEDYFLDEFRYIYQYSVDVARKANLLSGLPKYLLETLTVGAILGVLAFSLLTGGDLGKLVAQLAVFAAAFFKLLPNVNSIYAYSNTMMYNKASVDLVYHDLKEAEELLQNVTVKQQHAESMHFADKIEMRGIFFRYENSDTDVIQNGSVTIRKGESTAFIGQSGGGKTTTVDVMLGLLKPQQGEILLDGRTIEDNYFGWLGLFGYIPQFIYLYDDSIRKNVAFGVPEKEIDDEKVWDALTKAQMKEFVESLPGGLDTEVGERGARLSGGQRQRIGIARALYNDPEILVFDEATSALDNETEKEVMSAIDSLHGTKTMIMIAHRLSTIENCDHVYKVENQHIEQVR
ncbi:MAG: ABC transporter ATP-binding protein/permease [Lachnospiraceae bacterium]|nr:ABC transporter ATP-binding protein/permease [Lachnospiraceae bacterium]MDE7240024.1 ABC transporter ATP-binding protein/permease [Lachnospiraceae bacterium]